MGHECEHRCSTSRRDRVVLYGSPLATLGLFGATFFFIARHQTTLNNLQSLVERKQAVNGDEYYNQESQTTVDENLLRRVTRNAGSTDTKASIDKLLEEIADLQVFLTRSFAAWSCFFDACSLASFFASSMSTQRKDLHSR